MKNGSTQKKSQPCCMSVSTKKTSTFCTIPAFLTKIARMKHNKTAIITRGNSGIDQQNTIKFAKNSFDIVIGQKAQTEP